MIAAAQRGVAVDVQLFPDGAPAADALPRGTRVAVLQLRKAGSAPPDPLPDQPHRMVVRTTRRLAEAVDVGAKVLLEVRSLGMETCTVSNFWPARGPKTML